MFGLCNVWCNVYLSSMKDGTWLIIKVFLLSIVSGCYIYERLNEQIGIDKRSQKNFNDIVVREAL